MIMKQVGILLFFLLFFNSLLAQDDTTELKELTIDVAKNKYIIDTASKRTNGTIISPQSEILEKIIFSSKYHGLHINRLKALILRDYLTYRYDKETKDYKVYLKINFYYENLEKISSTDTIVFQQKRKNYLDIILKEKIIITKEPLYIGLEFIGIENNEGIFINAFDADVRKFWLRPIFYYKDMGDELQSLIYSRNLNSKDKLYPQSLITIADEKRGMEHGNYYYFSYEIQ